MAATIIQDHGDPFREAGRGLERAEKGMGEGDVRGGDLLCPSPHHFP